MTGLGLFFAAVPDPRAGNARHDLSEVLFIAFAAMLCGAERRVDMAAFGAAKRELFGSLLALEHGVPSHDTFSRLFRLLDPKRFEAAFRAFMTRFAAALSGQIGTAGQIVALDGKSLCGAVDPAKPTQPLHLVTAWAAEQRLRSVTMRCRAGSIPPRRCGSCGRTGASRTISTGCSTSPSTRTAPIPATTTPPRTLSCSAAWHSICSAPRRKPTRTGETRRENS